MGPGGSSSDDATDSITRAPTYRTNITPKNRYREALHRSIKMMHTISKVENKAKGLFICSETLIFEACDSIAQDILTRADRAGKVDLAGKEDDECRTKLVEGIIGVVAQDTPAESVRREVDILTVIQTCVRGDMETPERFSSRLNRAVARYAIQCGEMDQTTDRQFAVLMIRNAKLSNDTMNSLTFKLTAMAAESDARKPCVCVPMDVANKIASTSKKADASEVEMSLLVEELEKLCQKMENKTSQQGPMVTMDQVAQSLAQVDVTTGSRVRDTDGTDSKEHKGVCSEGARWAQR